MAALIILALIAATLGGVFWYRRHRWNALSPAERAAAIALREKKSVLKAAEKAYAGRVRDAEKFHKTAVKQYDKGVKQAERRLEKAREFGTRKVASLGGVVAYEDRLSTSSGSASYLSLKHVQASVQQTGTKTVAKDRRTTATRVIGGTLVAGPVGAIVGATAKKGKTTVVDTRECYLHIDTDTFYAVENVKPEKGAAAHSLAAAINNAFRQASSIKKQRDAGIRDAEKALAEARAATRERDEAADALARVKADTRDVDDARAALPPAANGRLPAATTR